MKYELDVMAALVQLSNPTTEDIVLATGFSARKVQQVVKTLQIDLYVVINKTRKGRRTGFSVKSWGVFETGSSLKEMLRKRTLITHSQQTSPNTASKSFAKKAAYYDSVKMGNYIESARLEGITIPPDPTLTAPDAIQKRKQELIEKYSGYRTSGKHHVR